MMIPSSTFFFSFFLFNCTFEWFNWICYISYSGIVFSLCKNATWIDMHGNSLMDKCKHHVKRILCKAVYLSLWKKKNLLSIFFIMNTFIFYFFKPHNFFLMDVPEEVMCSRCHCKLQVNALWNVFFPSIQAPRSCPLTANWWMEKIKLCIINVSDKDFCFVSLDNAGIPLPPLNKRRRWCHSKSVVCVWIMIVTVKYVT